MRRQSRAFDWYLAQPIMVIAAGVYGLIAGRMFHSGNLPLAWTAFIFGYVAVLTMELGLAFFLCYRSRLRRGDYRGGFHIGLASAFSLTTVFLGGIALTTLGLESGTVYFNGTVLRTRPDLLYQMPIFYGCSLLVGLISGPLYALTSPLR